MGLNGILYYLFAVSAVLSALSVVLTRNTVHSALHFVGHLLCLAGLYSLLHAPLLGVLQVMVYAGAVMVLFLFAVMILDMGEQERAQLTGARWQAVAAFVVAVALAAALAAFAKPSLSLSLAPAGDAAKDLDVDNIAAIARILFRDYALAFESVGVLLLTAVVAVMVMAKRKLES